MPDLIPDVARRQSADGTRLLPETGVSGHVLTVVSQSPFRSAFVQVPASRIPRYPGPPNGELTAQIDSLVIDSTTHTLWINTDGGTTWEPVGSSVTAAGANDTFSDPTGVAVATATSTSLPFVPTSGTPYDTPDGNILPGTLGPLAVGYVQADSHITVTAMAIIDDAPPVTDCLVTLTVAIINAGTSDIRAFGGIEQIVPATAPTFGTVGAVTVAASCTLGDAVLVNALQDSGATLTFRLGGSVASLLLT